MSIFYVIFLLLAVYFSIRYDKIEEYDAHKEHRLWLMCFYLICLSGFSYGLGADKFAYLEEFEEYSQNMRDLGPTIEYNMLFTGQMPLWTIVNALCKVVFDSFYAVQLLESAAINITVCYLAFKYTKRVFLFLIIYFITCQYFIFNTEVMREGFALSLILLGMHFYMTGKKWAFWLSIPIGLLFHMSAVIALIFPPSKIKLSWKTLYITVISTFVFWLFSDILFGRVISAVMGGEGSLVQKILLYSLQSTPFFGYLRAVLTYLVFPFIVMYTTIQMETDKELKNRKMKLMQFMIYLAIPASSFAGFARFFNYVYVFYLIMLADFLYTLFQTKKYFIIRAGTIMGICFVLYLQYFAHYETTNTYYYNFFYPYTCILDESVDVSYRSVAHNEAINGITSDTRDI